MIGTAIWTCYFCYTTSRTQMDTEATVVETPRCCGKPMWLTGVPLDTHDAASSEGKEIK